MLKKQLKAEYMLLGSVQELKKIVSELVLNPDAFVAIFSISISLSLGKRLLLTVLTALAKHFNLFREDPKKWDNGGYQEERDLM